MSAFDIVVSVGGTGAKCTEGLLHLGAAGLLGSKQVHVIPIDQDQSNGNLSRMRAVAQQLIGYRQHLLSVSAGSQDCGGFSLGLTCSNALKPAEDAHSRLRSVFELGEEGGRANTDDKIMMQALYSKEERNRTMDNGFEATPPLGAAVFARWMEQENAPFQLELSAVLDRHTANRPVRVLVVGSLFGGTGAAGVPTLARFIRNFARRRNLTAYIGGVLMMPYFQIEAASRFGPRSAAQASAALTYYRDAINGDDPLFHRLYLLGFDPAIPVAADGGQGGGAGQINPALLPELYAALAMADFLTEAPGALEDSTKRLRLISREDSEIVTWKDIPQLPGAEVERALRSMLLAAYAYHYALRPSLEPLRFAPEVLAKLPLYGNFMDVSHRDQMAAWRDAADTLDAYCVSFLTWVGGIQACHPGEVVWRLFDVGTPEYLDVSGPAQGWRVAGIKESENVGRPNAAAAWIKDGFDRLLGGETTSGLADLVSQVSSRRCESAGRRGVHRLFQAVRETSATMIRPVAYTTQQP